MMTAGREPSQQWTALQQLATAPGLDPEDII
jgi:hypothetical protein